MNSVPRILAVVAALAFGSLAGACASAPDTRAEQSELEVEARSTLDLMKSKDSSLEGVLRQSAGYAVFPTIGEGAFIAGVMSGVGVVYDGGGQVIGNVEVSGGSFGAQVGGQRYSQLIIFQNENALRDFQRDDFEMSTDASATALDMGAAARLSFEDGIAVVVDDEEGLMAEASLDGQQYDYKPAG